MSRFRIVVATFGMLALAACETTSSPGAVQPGISDEPTGSVARTDPKTIDPKDDLGLGKLHFRAKNYGLAEKHFRAQIEKTPQNTEAWLGLAASYDHLRRFDLADRAYAQVFRYSGRSVAALNNRGYSFMMRGELAKAHRDFSSALRLDPQNVRVANNMRLLEARYKGAGR